jgi:hypothetical protein
MISRSRLCRSCSRRGYALGDLRFLGLGTTCRNKSADSDFVHFGMHNYAQVQNPIDQSTLANLRLNPVNLVPGAIAHGFKPIYMINSYGDHPTAYHQPVTMVCLLQSSGLSEGSEYRYLTIPGSLHSFSYWGSSDGTGNDCNGSDCTVGDDVIGLPAEPRHRAAMIVRALQWN